MIIPTNRNDYTAGFADGYRQGKKDAERKKGRWLDDHGNEKKDGYGADCSVCGWWSEYLTDFCGSCGADMRGGEDET